MNGWRPLYRVGAAVAVIGLALMAFDIVLSMMPGWDTGTTPATSAAWLEQMAASPLLGLRNLDLLNVGISFVMLPMYVALYGAFRDRQQGVLLLGLITVVAGSALFAASNAALPMLGLSREYAVASAAEHPALVAAAASLLARGAHGSFGAFPGFLLSEVGTLLVALGMARGTDRGKAGWLGVAGAAALVAYSVLTTFGMVPAGMLTALAAPGGLLVMAWQVAVARLLWRRAAEPVTAPV